MGNGWVMGSSNNRKFQVLKMKPFAPEWHRFLNSFVQYHNQVSRGGQHVNKSQQCQMSVQNTAAPQTYPQPCSHRRTHIHMHTCTHMHANNLYLLYISFLEVLADTHLSCTVQINTKGTTVALDVLVHPWRFPRLGEKTLWSHLILLLLRWPLVLLLALYPSKVRVSECGARNLLSSNRSS
jgi:hypothetical protein